MLLEATWQAFSGDFSLLALTLYCSVAESKDFMYFQPPLDHCFCNCRYEGHEEGLWLHCVRYSGPGWTYECPYPDWATLSL
ncbi:hypothetical protein WN944_019215 [Citrus x changshan-huyou]|uniref:Uncharacterized protein n=1 Tax=Citrus x changshan-huyou TaxID=2935761 RepID=A0AAP0LVS5_9ROSI